MDALQLKQAGFSDQEVSQYTELQKAGFTDPEISTYLSKGTPKNPPAEGTITTAPPKWVPWAKGATEAAGLLLAGPFGYAGAKQLTKLAPTEPPPLAQVPPTDVETEKKLNPLGLPYKSEEDRARVISAGREGLGVPSWLGKIGEKGKEISRDIQEGLGMEMGGQAIGKVIPKVLPLYARGRVPGAEEVSKIAEREGIRIPAADITGSTTQAAIASSVQKLPQSAYTMQKEAVNATGQFANYVERTLSKTGGKVEPFIAGQAAQEGRLLRLSENKIAGAKLYDQAKIAAKDVNVSYDSINKTMADVQSSDAYQLLSDTSKKEVDKVISFVEGKIRPEISARARSSLKLPVDVEQKVLAQAGQEFTPTTYMEAEGIRKSIADKLFSKNIKGTEAQGPIRRLYDALQQDMEASVKGTATAIQTPTERMMGGEYITGVAMKRKDGSIISGIDFKSTEKTHAGLWDKLSMSERDKIADYSGYITSKGKYLTNKEATEFVGKGVDANEIVGKAGKPESVQNAHQLFINARDFWSQNVFGEGAQKEMLGKLAPTAEGGVSPERAITLLKNASLTDVGKIKAGMSGEHFTSFRQGLLTHVFERNSRTSEITGEVIYNGSQIAKDLFGKSGLGEAKLRALVTPEEFTFLKELATVGERMGSSWRIAGNPSGTAHTLYVLHLLGATGAAVGELTTDVLGGTPRQRVGGAIAGAGIAAGAFMSPYVVAKLITSNVGRRYLIGGFPKLERAISRGLPPGIAGVKGMLEREQPEKEKGR